MEKRKWNKTFKPTEITLGFNSNDNKKASNSGLLTSRYSKTGEGFTFTHNNTKYRYTRILYFWFS